MTTTFATFLPAGQLPETGAEANWWFWLIGGALVLLGIVFLILRGRKRTDEDEVPVEAAPATTTMAMIDPTVGDGPSGTTPIPTEVPDEPEQPLFKPSDGEGKGQNPA